MATATHPSSRANGASRSVKRVAHRADSTAQQITRLLSRESAALSRRATELYSTTRRSARNHPMAAVGIVAGVAALIGGAWYALKNR